MTRRLLALAVLLTVTVACGPEVTTESDGDPGPGATSGDGTDGPIVIGFLGELSGSFAVYGEPARNGMLLAVEELNAGGGVDGRSLELVVRDTEGSPDEATIAFTELVDQRGAVAVGGVISSDVGLATARRAEADGVPLLLTKAGSEAILTRDSRMTFRTCLPAAPMNVDAIVQYIEAAGIVEVGAIVADYAWGRSIEAALTERLDATGLGLHVEVAPVPETDFTTYLRRLQAAEVELLVATGHPPGVTSIVSQAADLGLDAPVTGPNAPLAALVAGAGEGSLGRFLDLSCADTSSEDFIALAGRYHDRFGAYMEDDAVTGYAQVTVIAEAIERTGSADPVEVAEALREGRFEVPGYAYPLSWTPWGELAEAAPILVGLEASAPPEGVNPGADWFPRVTFRADAVTPYEP